MTINPEMETQLVQSASHARGWAYAPYSKYAVGAALLTESGRIYDGVNVENAAYPSGMCAERVAIFKAVSEGERKFSAIAVVTSNGGSPCGGCRQVMAEFGLDMQVIIVNAEGTVTQRCTVADLLPDAFTPDRLQAG
jgi:cytidine deaminase